MGSYCGLVLPADYSPDDPDDDYRYGDYRPMELDPGDEIAAATLAGIPIARQLVEAQKDVAWAEFDVARCATPATYRALRRAREKLALLEQAMDLGRA